MRVLARVHLFPPEHCAGAEMMLVELLKALIARGHQCEVHLSRFCAARAPYVLDGIEVYPRETADWQDRASKADVLLTHLDNTSTVISAALAFRKPLVQVLHNTHPPTRMWATCRNDLLVYNSEWMADALGRDPNGIVVRPPVRVADYDTGSRRGDYVTLINLNPAKGGVIFAQLAALMPDQPFLAVKGAYGEQIEPRLPNVTVISHAQLPMHNVYLNTSVLVMPSSYESWGRTGVEAMCSGIPVLATGTPGLRESLGTAGVFLKPDADAHAWRSVLELLLTDQAVYAERSAAARQRASELDPTDELAAFCDRVEAL